MIGAEEFGSFWHFWQREGEVETGVDGVSGVSGDTDYSCPAWEPPDDHFVLGAIFIFFSFGDEKRFDAGLTYIHIHNNITA